MKQQKTELPFTLRNLDLLAANAGTKFILTARSSSVPLLDSPEHKTLLQTEPMCMYGPKRHRKSLEIDWSVVAKQTLNLEGELQ